MFCGDDISVHKNQRGSLGNHTTDAMTGNTVAGEGRECGVGCFRCHGHQQAPGGLGVEQKVLMLG